MLESFYNEKFVGSPGYLWRKGQIDAISKFIRAWIGPSVSGSKTSKEWVEEIDGRSVMVMQVGNARHPVVLKVFPSTVLVDDPLVTSSTNAYVTVEDSYTSYYPEVGYTKEFSTYFSLGTRISRDGSEEVVSFLFAGDLGKTILLGSVGSNTSLSDVDTTTQKALQNSTVHEAKALAEWKSVAAYIKKRLELWDEENYVSRSVADFENNPVIQELEDYFNVGNDDRWEMITDDSMTKNRSEYVIHLDDREESKNSLSVKIKDIGGGKYLYFLDLHGSSTNDWGKAREYKNVSQLMTALRKNFKHTYRYNEMLGVPTDTPEQVGDRLYKLISSSDKRFLTHRFNKPKVQKEGILLSSKEVITGEPLVSFLVRESDIILAISPYDEYSTNTFTTKSSWESEIISKYANLSSEWRSARKLNSSDKEKAIESIWSKCSLLSNEILKAARMPRLFPSRVEWNSKYKCAVSSSYIDEQRRVSLAVHPGYISLSLTDNEGMEIAQTRVSYSGNRGKEWQERFSSRAKTLLSQVLETKGEMTMIRKAKKNHYRRVNELRATNISTNVRYPEEVFDRVVSLIGDALGDTHLKRNCVIDVRPRKDGTEKWDILLRNSNAAEVISVVIGENGNIIDSSGPDNLITRKAPAVRLDNQRFLDWLGEVSDNYLNEYGSFNKSSAKIVDGEYVDPDYDLANWSDRFLNKYEGDIIDLTNDYDLDLEESSDEKEYKNGRITFTGSYKDKAGKPHSLEVRLFWSVGDKFKVWVRPDMKGSSSLKWDGQRTLSALKDWVTSNVARRSSTYEGRCRKRTVEYSSFDDASVRDEIVDAVIEELEDVFGQADVVQDNGRVTVVDVDGDNQIAIKCTFKSNQYLVHLDGDYIGAVRAKEWSSDPGDALESIKDCVEEWVEDNYIV